MINLLSKKHNAFTYLRQRRLCLSASIELLSRDWICLDLPLQEKFDNSAKQIQNYLRVSLHPLNTLTVGQLKKNIAQSLIQPSGPISLSDKFGIVADNVLVSKMIESIGKNHTGSITISGKSFPIQLNPAIIQLMKGDIGQTGNMQVVDKFQPVQSVEGLVGLDCPIEEQKEIDSKARKSLNLKMWVIFGLMGFQTGLLARWTWWDYSWDIVEPMTYFITYGTCIAWYSFFLLNHQDLTYQTFSKLTYSRKFHKQMSRLFNITKSASRTNKIQA